MSSSESKEKVMLRFSENVLRDVSRRHSRYFPNPLLNCKDSELSQYTASKSVWLERLSFLIAWIASHNVQIAAELKVDLWKVPHEDPFERTKPRPANGTNFYTGDISCLMYILWRLKRSSSYEYLRSISRLIQSRLPHPNQFAMELQKNLSSGDDWINQLLQKIQLKEEENICTVDEMIKSSLAWALKWNHADDLGRPSMIEGPNGLHAFNYLLNDSEQSLRILLKFQELLKLDNSNPSSLDDMSNEVLYGRSGLLYCFLFVCVHKSESIAAKDIPEALQTAISSLVKDITESGKICSHYAKIERQWPLLYYWHDSDYFGAAHGVVGIVQMLLHSARFTSIDFSLISDTVVQIERSQSEEGGFSTRMLPEKKSKLLYQWCHGPTGVIPLVLQFKRFSSNDPKETLEDDVPVDHVEVCRLAAESLWEKGILTKGVGLCHGISGNAYSFLHLANHLSHEAFEKGDSNPEISLWRNRALCFAEISWQNLDILWTKPDEPFCVMNGLSGMVVFILDLLEESQIDFQGFPFFADLNNPSKNRH